MTWKGVPKDISKWTGFVYLIINKENGMKYIGQKNFHRKLTRKPLKGKKRKRVSYPESNWKDYYGSSQKLLDDVEEYGKEAFERYILILCKTKWGKNFWETKLQFDNEVLLDDSYYNGIVNCRINRRPISSNFKFTEYIKMVRVYDLERYRQL